MENEKTENKQPEKTAEEKLKEHLAKYSWLWEDDSPYPWENKVPQQVIKNNQKTR